MTEKFWRTKYLNEHNFLACPSLWSIIIVIKNIENQISYLNWTFPAFCFSCTIPVIRLNLNRIYLWKKNAKLGDTCCLFRMKCIIKNVNNEDVRTISSTQNFSDLERNCWTCSTWKVCFSVTALRQKLKLSFRGWDISCQHQFVETFAC